MARGMAGGFCKESFIGIQPRPSFTYHLWLISQSDGKSCDRGLWTGEVHNFIESVLTPVLDGVFVGKMRLSVLKGQHFRFCLCKGVIEKLARWHLQ